MSARWAPNLSASIELTGTDLDPGVLLHEWPGRVGARVRADAALEGEDLRVALHELAIDGRLRDRPIALSARGAYAADSLRIDAFALRSGSTDVSARGTAGTELALEWRIESPDLRRSLARARRTDLGERRAARSARSAARRSRGTRGRTRLHGLESRRLRAHGRRRRRGKSSFVAHARLLLGASAGRRDCATAIDRRGQRRPPRSRAHDDDERRHRGARPDRQGRQSLDAWFRVELRARQGNDRVPGARPVGAPRTCHRPRHEDGSRARPGLLAERHGGALRRRDAWPGPHGSAVHAFAASIRLLRGAARRARAARR